MAARVRGNLSEAPVGFLDFTLLLLRECLACAGISDCVVYGAPG